MRALAPIGYTVLMEFPGVAGLGVAPKLDFWIAAGTPNVPPIHVAFRVDPDVVHPVTPAMVGDVNAPDQIAIPYYENIPLKA